MLHFYILCVPDSSSDTPTRLSFPYTAAVNSHVANLGYLIPVRIKTAAFPVSAGLAVILAYFP